MKKNVKKVLVASTAALALAGSFIGCSQPVAPSLDKTKVPSKDVYEQNLDTARMEAESLFGKNIIKFYDVNYADDSEYKLYRFGPMDDPLKGKPLTLSSANHSADSFYYEDKVDFGNPMVAGSYTYKLVAKSAINSARAVAAKNQDLSINKDTDAANQDYWANPNVDIVYIPSVASVSFNVSESNMPKLKTKLTLTKDELKGKYVVVDEENTIWFYPGVGDNLELEARLSKIDPNFDFSNNDSIGTTDVTFVADKSKTDEINKLVIPNTTAGTWDIYATKKFDNDYYRKSEKVLVDTIKVDPIGKDIHSDGKVIVTQSMTPNGLGKLGALTYKLDKDLNYTFEAMRAEKVTYKYAKETSGYETDNKEYYSDVTPVTFTTTVEEIKNAEGKVVAKKYIASDASAQADKTYRYFWTFKDGNRVIDYGETELTVTEAKLAKVEDYLVIEDITTAQLSPVATTATDLTWNTLRNEFTVQVKPKSYVKPADKAKNDLAKAIFNNFKVTVKRVSIGEKDGKDVTNIVDVTPVRIPGANGEVYLSICENNFPFLEDKASSKDGTYKYFFYFVGGDGTELPVVADLGTVTTISKKRYTDAITLKATKAEIKTNEASITLEFTATPVTYATRAEVKAETPVLNRAELAKIPLTEYKINYDVRCDNNNSYVFSGKSLLADLKPEDVAKAFVGTPVTIKIPGLKAGYRYTIKSSHAISGIPGQTSAVNSYSFNTPMIDLKDNFEIKNKGVVNYIVPEKQDAKTFGADDKTKVEINLEIANKTGKTEKFDKWELVDVTRKPVNAKVTDTTKIADKYWRTLTSSKAAKPAVPNDFEVTVDNTTKLPIKLVDEKLFFNDVADKAEYIFRFYNVNEGFAVLKYDVATKNITRWTEGYDILDLKSSTPNQIEFKVVPRVNRGDDSYKITGSVAKATYFYEVSGEGITSPTKETVELEFNNLENGSQNEVKVSKAGLTSGKVYTIKLYKSDKADATVLATGTATAK